jgi:hypothetical protein
MEIGVRESGEPELWLGAFNVEQSQPAREFVGVKRSAPKGEGQGWFPRSWLGRSSTHTWPHSLKSTKEALGAGRVLWLQLCNHPLASTRPKARCACGTLPLPDGEPSMRVIPGGSEALS